MTERLYKFIFSNQAEKFLTNPSNPISKSEAQVHLLDAIRKLTREEEKNIDVRKMKGQLKGWYRVRIGKIRIVFLFEEGEIRIVRVDRADYRGNVYN